MDKEMEIRKLYTANRLKPAGLLNLWFWLVLLFPIAGNTQQSNLWGHTSSGGANGMGAIVRYDSVGGNGVVQHSFTSEFPGAIPGKMSLIPYDEKMYGTTAYGGRFGAGLIFSWDPSTREYQVEHQFTNGLGGANPEGGLLYYNGRMYGTTKAGGMDDKGTVYEFNPDTRQFVVRHHFSGTDGERPQCTLVEYLDNLYGVTPFGGANNQGVIFSLNSFTKVFTKHTDMTQSKGGHCYGSLLLHNGNLWGLASDGGEFGLGSIFRYEFFYQDYFRSRSFSSTTHSPRGSLAKSLLNEFDLYATASGGGVFGHGAIFRYNTFNNDFDRPHSFSGSGGSFPTGDLLIIRNPDESIFQEYVYGFTELGGTPNPFNEGAGVAYKLTIYPNTFEVVKYYDYENGGATPRGAFAEVPGTNILVATTTYGGASGNGTLFSMVTANNGITKELDFGASAKGSDARDRVVEWNGKLYGITHKGGQHNGGVLFSFDTASKAYTVLHHFSKATGWKCFDAPVLDSGKLYGTTKEGGAIDAGVLYAFDIATQTFSVRQHFGQAVGLYPGKLVKYQGKYWSTCRGGGSQDAGTLFTWNPSTNQLTKLKDFSSADSFKNPYGTLLAIGPKLYGVAGGGSFDMGILYEYDTATTTITIKKHFDPEAIGGQPGGNLVLKDGKVYGTCGFGGSTTSQFGSIWEWTPASNQLVRKQLLSGTGTGESPRGGFMEHKGLLYASTWLGGNFNLGTVLQYNAATNSVTKKHNASNSTGAYPEGVLVAITQAAPTCPSLGADISIALTCANDSTDITKVFVTTGFTQLNWNVANPLKAPVGLHQLIATNAQGCVDTALARVYNKVAIWTGQQNSLWTNVGNWLNNELPTGEHHVIIPAGTSNWPVVTASILVLSLQVKNGATLQIEGTGNIITTGVCSKLPD